LSAPSPLLLITSTHPSAPATFHKCLLHTPTLSGTPSTPPSPSISPTHLPSTSLTLLFDHPPSSSTLRPHPPLSSLTPPTFARLHPPSSSVTLTPLRPHPPSFDPTHLLPHSELSSPPTHLPLPPAHLAIMSVTCATCQAHTPSFDLTHLPLRPPPTFLFDLCVSASSFMHVAHVLNIRSTHPSFDPTHLPSTSLTFLRPHPPFFDPTYLPRRPYPPSISITPTLPPLLSPAISQQLYACGIWHSSALQRLSQVTFSSHIHLYTQSADA
jgi:hypothetical protein